MEIEVHDSPDPMRLLLPALLTALHVTQAQAAACTERLSLVRGIIDKDLRTGFIGKDVHAKLSRELETASQACRAGQDGRAQLLISSTQSRHGYPVR
jgi:hypothetical protein